MIYKCLNCGTMSESAHPVGCVNVTLHDFVSWDDTVLINALRGCGHVYPIDAPQAAEFWDEISENPCPKC